MARLSPQSVLSLLAALALFFVTEIIPPAVTCYGWFRRLRRLYLSLQNRYLAACPTPPLFCSAGISP